MAYAAIISLQHTLNNLQNSSDIVLVSPSRKIIEYTCNKLKSLQNTLERLDTISISCSREKVNDLDGEIREQVSRFDDILDSYLYSQILSQSNADEWHPLLFSADLEQEIDCFSKKLMNMEEKYIKVLNNLVQEEDEDEDDDVSSTTDDFDGRKSKMFGLSELYNQLKDELISGWSSEFQDLFPHHFIPFVGMAGIGKTRFAKEIFEDPDIVEFFDCCAWVKVGRKYRLPKIRRLILAQMVDVESDQMLVQGDEEITRCLEEILEGTRFLLVLDDVWDKDVMIGISSLLPKSLICGSRILLTTRLQSVAKYVAGPVYDGLSMPFLSNKVSWDLLRYKVFGEGRCPPQLEKAGKKIAENCEGLPLMIETVASLLCKAEKTPEYWNEVAEKKNSLFLEAYTEILEVLSPSYEILHQHLKPCFLYMGVFPQDYVISKSQLEKLWKAEVFLEPFRWDSIVKNNMVECLDALVSSSLVMLQQQSTMWYWRDTKVVKTCKVHSTVWHLCKREATKNKFFQVLSSQRDCMGEGIKDQRRLCIHNNVLFVIKDVHNSMVDNCASTARSLLCYGPYHQYTVPICFGLKLLKVLDVLTIRFHEFPLKVLKLVQLRYFALTYNGSFPSSISELGKLQFLIVRQHLCIRLCGVPSYLPMQIWDMKELKHLQILGSDLQNPLASKFLSKLSTLLDVSARNCTLEVFKAIPNLKRLGIRIELTHDVDETSSIFDHISQLNRLKSLKCVIVNPVYKTDDAARLAPLSNLPSSLQKLTLSGLSYPWEEINKLASLPELEVLKLRGYACRGPKWEMEEIVFPKLRVLVIEDSDLVQWEVGRGSFPKLKALSIKHCYKLRELNWVFDRDVWLSKIQMIDCNPLAMTSMKQIEEGTEDVCLHSSWIDGDIIDNFDQRVVFRGY